MFDTSAVGHGFTDLVCGYAGQSFNIEIKDGKKYPSQRKLTEAQEQFKQNWKGHYQVIESVEQAQLWAKAIKRSGGQSVLLYYR